MGGGEDGEGVADWRARAGFELGCDGVLLVGGQVGPGVLEGRGAGHGLFWVLGRVGVAEHRVLALRVGQGRPVGAARERDLLGCRQEAVLAGGRAAAGG